MKIYFNTAREIQTFPRHKYRDLIWEPQRTPQWLLPVRSPELHRRLVLI